MPKVTGGKSVVAGIASIAADSPDGRTIRAIGAALFAAGEAVSARAAVSMTDGRSEVKDKKNHVPSKPGEPPAVRDGDLRRGLEVIQETPLRVRVNSNDAVENQKPIWLEFGTSKMAARPYLGPALQHEKAEVARLMAGALRLGRKLNNGA